MKKLLLASTLLSMALCLSCKKDVPVPPPVPMAPPAGPSATPPATPPPAPQTQNGTSVKIGEDGIKVDAQKTKVTIDSKGTAVEVKK